MPDGLPSALGDIGSESILDLGIDIADLAADSVSGAVLANGGVGGAKLAANAVSGANITSEYGVVIAGSPAGYGQSIQCGNGTLGAGSDLWVAFPKAFLAAPTSIVCTGRSANTGFQVIAGSIVAGSFYVQGETASATFSWLAVGSGRP